MPIWRSKIYSLSHSASFIWKCCGAISMAALLAAMLAQSFRQSSTSAASASGDEEEEWVLRAREIYARLEHFTEPMPDVLAELLRVLRPEAPGWQFESEPLRYGALDLRAQFSRHLPSEEQREIFADFIRCRLLEEPDARQESMARLNEAAARPVRYANEFTGEILKDHHRLAEALKAYVREGSFADAHRARSQAFVVAVMLQDKATLRSLTADGRFMQDADVFTSYQAASLLDDRWMLARAVVRLQWHSLTHADSILLALFAALVWYLILVYSASRERWRWLRYLPAVLAGVWSICLLRWMQGTLHYGLSEGQQVTPTHEIFQWVMYVGVPEEVAKLCFFLPFLPFLLRHASASKAALTAGCVGLGFALGENLDYFRASASTVALGRFVTANFMHIALTGILGGWLYELLRSRFHAATDFLMAFLGVAAAHGVYDFSSTTSGGKLGVEIVGTIILALAARFYLGRLRPEEVSMRRRTLSSTSVFCIGSALLTGATILMAVDEAGSMKGAVSVLRQTVAIIPAALIYVREFREL